MDAFIAEIKTSQVRPGFDEILVPGEIDYRREQAYRREGAQLDVEVFERLRQLAQTLAIDFPFERRQRGPE